MGKTAKGRPASPGRIGGPVKVVNTLDELDKVEAGDVMVVKFSNPAYAIGMMKAAALVSEMGGIISHTAIVAREMGIPCVVAVERATELFKDGQMVIVDGDQGTVDGN